MPELLKIESFLSMNDEYGHAKKVKCKKYIREVKCFQTDRQENLYIAFTTYQS